MYAYEAKEDKVFDVFDFAFSILVYFSLRNKELSLILFIR